LIVALVAVAPMAAGCPKDAPQPPAAGTEEGKLTSPRLVRRIEAQFPAQAKRAGIRKAEVHVQFRIGTDGRPRDLNVVECSHIDVGFEGASMRAVKRWRYLPALADGSPVEVYQIVTIDFALPADEAQSGD
jgi:protein TonB